MIPMKTPIEIPDLDPRMQRKWMLGNLSLQNLIQVAIYLIALGLTAGAFKASIGATVSQVDQNKQDIADVKREIAEQRDFELKLSAKLDLILYRLDRLDKQPAHENQ